VSALLALALLPTAPYAHALQHQHGDPADTSSGWRMPMRPDMPDMMLPGMADYRPPLTPFRPGAGVDPASLAEARPNEMVHLADGDTLVLASGLVRRTIDGKSFVMYGFNGQYPGPLIRVDANTTVVVAFVNGVELPSTIHWHGVRLDNRFDGVPGVTQELVAPGERFVYRVHFPDPGIYWYHPHHREDIQQELGLYGNMLVDSPDQAFWGPAHRDEILMLDDLLVQDGEIAPFGLEASNHTLMGRFGNVMLVNGEPEYRLRIRRGEVVRFFFTNVSNTRMFNLGFGGAPIKVVGGDIGRIEREAFAPGVVIAPAERYVVVVRFDRAGRFPVVNRVQAVDHWLGEFYPTADTLGWVTVGEEAATPDLTEAFERLRHNEDVTTDVARYREHFDRAPDFEAVLTIHAGDLPQGVIQYMSIDTTYFPPVEWNDAMPMMNWVSNGANTRWILRDARSGRENMDVDWTVDRGAVVKIRLRNDAKAFHPMSHPIHLHGQRFLVVERDGVRNPHFVWKETVLVPVGTTVDLLVDASNPGRWMLHCHIAEHLEAGMKLLLTVR
jgi:FtsP/CotA-like multicopper oxidase with cupredoxin domain